MSYSLGSESLARLNTAHPDLRRVFLRAIRDTPIDFKILEGVRSKERQRMLLNQGATKTLRSRHLPHPDDGLSRAVDAGPWVKGSVSWRWTHYHQLAKAIKAAAAKERVPIEWGGDWDSFPDGPHWQLPWALYP